MRSPAVRLVVLGLALVAVVGAALLLRNEPQPYVITAIDYHFHDAHPTFPITPGRDLLIKNAGSNVHNVTIPALDIVSDIAPGDEFIVQDIAGRLAPGRYDLVCRLHRDRGMVGEIVIVDA